MIYQDPNESRNMFTAKKKQLTGTRSTFLISSQFTNIFQSNYIQDKEELLL